MEKPTPESPFQDLPEGLVEEMLSQYKTLGERLSKSLEEVQRSRAKVRDSLTNHKLLRDDATVIRSHIHPTTCGIDGSYAIERLLSTDIAAMAAVAVEGLTPPSEKRHWPQPHHLSKVFTVEHNEATSLIVRAIMITMELELAAKGPHDVVFLDGSLTTPLIHLNQALSRLREAPSELSKLLLDRMESALDAYGEVLASKRSDKIYAGLPKYTSRNELSKIIGLSNHEDRAVLSQVLNGGEVVGPFGLLQQGEDWHFSSLPNSLELKGREAVSLIRSLSVIYYRPAEHFPTLRIEVSPAVSGNLNRLSIVLESLQLQCGAPGIMEPYPLYLADRMVKHLGTAVPVIRRATTQEMASATSGDVGSIFLAMHGYRTEH
jgi:hypothetical protein